MNTNQTTATETTTQLPAIGTRARNRRLNLKMKTQTENTKPAVIRDGNKIIVRWNGWPTSSAIRRMAHKLGVALNVCKASSRGLISWNGPANFKIAGHDRFSRRTLRRLGFGEMRVNAVNVTGSTPMISRNIQSGYARATDRVGWGNWPRAIFQSLIKERYSWGSPVAFERKNSAFLP